MSMQNPGLKAVEKKGWFSGHKWLILRRLVQLGVIGVFLVGPLTGFWLVKGTLAYSLTLETLPLSDPFIALQSLIAGHKLESTALWGAAFLLGFYLLVSGRVYCSWVCPINAVSDGASWLKRKLGWKKTGIKLPRYTALWIMGAVLITSLLTQTIAWEFVNPVTMLFRSIVFGSLMTIGFIVLVIFLIELVGGDRIWCSRLCPVGAFYGLIGKVGFLKVSATKRYQCNDCMDCYTVCPEAHVISPALKGEKEVRGPVILSGDCTNCARCLDVCSEDVFKFSIRTKNEMDDAPRSEEEKVA